MRGLGRWTLCAVLCSACGDDGGGGGTDETTSTGTSESTTTGVAGDTTHGFIKIEFHAAEGVVQPYTGTTTIRLTLDYLPCLVDFYDQNQQWRPANPDGQAIFEEWRERLCSDDVPNRIECVVESMSQELGARRALTVEYSTTESDIETKTALFGPLPTDELATCTDGSRPEVMLSPEWAVGEGGLGNTIWSGENVSPGTAEANQAEPMKIGAISSG